jgi:hypothetical protein
MLMYTLPAFSGPPGSFDHHAWGKRSGKGMQAQAVDAATAAHVPQHAEPVLMVGQRPKCQRR